ncbi:MAG: sulfotransferase domain-containing protein [Magnetospirillum sp.]|nr:sulfotransferase domain-containing protein [Magnetospirillum sp.]
MSGLILLASYPKSGNTWLRAMIASLQNGGGAVDINQLSIKNSSATREAFDDLMGIDSSDLTDDEILAARPALHRTMAAMMEPPLILKTHDANLIPPGGDGLLFSPESVARVIHVVRDPRDVAVSWAHHIGKDIDTAIARMADENDRLGSSRIRLNPQLPQFLSSWSRHTESWLDATGYPVLRLRYEEMVAAPLDSCSQIGRFLGLDVSAPVVAGATAAASFPALKAQEEEAGFAERLPASTAPFFRRGTAGGWRDSLTPGQAARIEGDHGPVMRRLGYLP